MARRRSRWARVAALLAGLAAAAGLAAGDLVWRRRHAQPFDLFMPPGRGDEERMGRPAGSGPHTPRSPYLPALADDPRLTPLRRAAASWSRSLASRRQVVDQVCLVPDVPTFFAAIAAWDDRHFFPILIDEPGWTLPFLRAFRPSRVVRYRGRGEGIGPDFWKAAVAAVGRAGGVPASDPKVPGLVLSAPESPMLAGAVALAAGRSQPLLRLEPTTWGLYGDGGAPLQYGDVLTLEQAWHFARRVEGYVAAVAPGYDRLGDACDFLTIAGDWPYRYNDRGEKNIAGGIQALDDLIGRSLADEPGPRGLAGFRHRWAFAGRLLGDPAASVARAMGALFLSPEAGLLWDTYEHDPIRMPYAAGPAAALLARGPRGPGRIFLAEGPAAELADWDRVMDPRNRFGFIWLNSSGSPTDFSIRGGPGRPADLPCGCPAAVVMIHSFSAADPSDPSTIAGRWLAQGAFVYYGSVNEPFLQAFRRPTLVADLARRGVPLSAALHQGGSEPFGRPWRLVYLGDPLYRFSAPGAGPGRLDPATWRRQAPDEDWRVSEVAPPSADAVPGADVPDVIRLGWCRDAAVAELARNPGGSGPPKAVDWRRVLDGIRRERLGPGLRPILDEMLVEAMTPAVDLDELASRLSRIPPGERRPRVEAALESAAILRLARVARDPDRGRSRDRIAALLDEVARAAWTPGSQFPIQFAARAAALLRPTR